MNNNNDDDKQIRNIYKVIIMSWYWLHMPLNGCCVGSCSLHTHTLNAMVSLAAAFIPGGMFSGNIINQICMWPLFCSDHQALPQIHKNHNALQLVLDSVMVYRSVLVPAKLLITFPGTNVTYRSYTYIIAGCVKHKARI